MTYDLITNMYPSVHHSYFGIFVLRIEHALASEGFRLHERVAITKSRSAIVGVACYVRFFLRSLKICLRSKSDFVYCHFAPHSPIIPALFSMLTHDHFPRPAIVTNLHGTDLLTSGWRRRLVRFSLKHSAVVIAPSRTAAAYASRLHRLLPNKILVSPSGGVSRPFFEIAAAGSDMKYFGAYMGNLSADKGIWDLFRAIASSERLRARKWLIAGSGPERLRLQEFLLSEGLQECVELVGPVQPEQAPFVYANCKWFVFPSRRVVAETLGLVGVESLATGTPVVGSDIPAIREYLTHELNGFLYPVGEVCALQAALERSTELDSRNYALYATAARRAAQAYRAERVMRELAESLRTRIKKN